MKLFRMTALAILITVGAFTLVTYTACKDTCKDVACLNGGACQDGKCVCPAGFIGANCEKTPCTGIECKNGGACKDGKCECMPGYEGSLCETLMADKFMGTWTGTDQCDISGFPGKQHTWNIEMGLTKSDIVIHNWWVSGGTRGIIKSSTEIEIPQQIWSTAGGVDELKGTIKYENGKLNVTYTLIGRGDCSATYQR